jgi:hypothetical protein
VAFNCIFLICVRDCNAIYWQNLGDQSWKRWGDYWVLLNSQFNEVYIAFYKLLLHRAFGQKRHAKYYKSRLHVSREAQLQLTLCCVSFKTGTERQEKHTVSITFLFTSEGHEAIWEPWILFFWTPGFLTRPDTNSHKQGPIAGSDMSLLLFLNVNNYWSEFPYFSTLDMPYNKS